MDELAHLRQSIEATRSVVKAAQRSLRTCGQFLADLEERLDELEDAQPRGGKADGYHARERASAQA